MPLRMWILIAAFVLATALGLQGSFAATLSGPPTWGNPNQPWGVRRPVTADDRALIQRYRSEHKQPLIATNFSNPAELQSLWTLQSDDQPFLKSCRRPENVVITSNELQLRTLGSTNCKAQWSTGSMISKVRQKYGFFEASIKAADISGLNNAFWLVTEDHFEIDITEVHFPNIARLTLHNNNNWDTVKEDKFHAVGFNSVFSENLSQSYHDYGVLWTPKDVIYEIDGEPVAAISINDSIKAAADIRFSTALTDYAGKIPSNPVGHHMYVRSLRVYPL
jgi:hypothetical protein